MSLSCSTTSAACQAPSTPRSTAATPARVGRCPAARTRASSPAARSGRRQRLCYRDCVKGIVLAGGTATRLFPLTIVTNKHLLPIYDRPMIYYPIETLLNAGIREIIIVTGGEHAGDFLKLLKNGKQLGVRHLEYAYQEGEGGIADALKLAEEFSDGDKICVVLGDNIIQ